METYFRGKVDRCSARQEPAILRSVTHDYPTVPLPRPEEVVGETVIPITDRCSYFYYYYM